jgi:glycosyltransferase involved in cell wall biosynthesis
MPRASVAAIIPVYNRPTAVLEALASVAAQQVEPAVLIVVDDGSTDETAATVETWLSQHPLPFEAKLIRQANAGVAAARNRGAAEAGEVELLAFLDSDDIWPNDYLARMCKIFSADATVIAASADRLDMDLRENHAHLSPMRPDRLTTTGLLVYGPPGTSNTLFRAAAFRQVGGYDAQEQCGEDYQFMLRISLLGRWAIAAGEPVKYRRGTPDAVARAGQLSRAFDDRRWRLACILDRFVTSDAPPGVLQGGAWRRRLGRLWYAAGRQSLAAGERDRARSCFIRASQHWPWHLRAQWRRLTCR